MKADESGRTAAGRIADAAGSLFTAALVFGATPAVLSIFVGNPLGSGLGHQWSLGPRVVLAALALVAWVAWVACCAQLGRAVVDHVRRRDVSAPAGALLSERIAVRIAAGVLALMAGAAPLTLAAGAGASSIESTAAAVGMAAPGTSAPAVVVASPTSIPSTSAPDAAAATYTVQPGDSLWSIADAQLGAGDDWPAIAALNLGRTMPDGLRFVDPNRIYAGWTLQMPDLHPLIAAPAEPEATPAPAVAGDPGVPAPTEGLTGRRLVRPPVATTHPRRPSAPATAAEAPDGAGEGQRDLPELIALGLGAIGCAALTRRARRMRLLRQVTSGEHAPGPEPSAGAVDTGILLARFTGVPALRALEAANGRLARVLGESGTAAQRTARIRVLCVGAAGVDFWLAEPGPPAPTGFILSEEGRVWHAPHEAAWTHEAAHPYLPIVLPVGEDEAGTWLVPLEHGDCLPFVGEAGGDLWRAARPVQEAWSWADMVLITEDPDLVAAEVRLHDHGGVSSVDGRRILYFGDPALLPAAVAHKVAIVTLSPASASDVTIVVDRRAASIHPIGRSVRPYLMPAETSALVGELVAPPPPIHPAVSDAVDDDICRPQERSDHPRSMDRGGGGVDVSALWDPGIVEVKLLAPAPRIEGLAEDLPANRARRAVELVAYLALHRDDEITSDRLRTRVLGSSDADAASKTLFNIATAARHALGTDATGVPLFPSGSRTGHYRVTEAVTVDVHRSAGLAALGSATEDPEAAMALLRRALDLVEGEPMANALSGYAWWEAEGHGARIAAVLVNAATDLAALAADAGRFDLAQWGLGQARLVDPYSEAISRAAMQVAASAGDADRLRREWRDCQRRMDELDPGSIPSRRTERLYGELTQRVLVDVGDVGDR